MENELEGKFIIRLYDGFDHCWTDVTGPLTAEEADKKFAELTDNKTKMTDFSDIDYYRIFPADTKMVFNGEVKMPPERVEETPPAPPLPEPHLEGETKEDRAMRLALQSLAHAERVMERLTNSVLFLYVIRNHHLTHPSIKPMIDGFLDGIYN
jgi:hypothetical protein